MANSEVFVGRGDELAVLAELLAGVRRGVGGAVLVEGEQGIGKSALLRTALAKGVLGEGLRVGWGSAEVLWRRFPLRLMADCLSVEGGDGRVGPSSGQWAGLAPAGATLAGGFSGDPVLAGIEVLLARADRLCASGPLVVVTEDLQWADDASLVVWRRLCRAAGQLPLLVVGSCRPGEGELAGLRQEVLAAGGRVVLLGPLGEREAAELAAGLIGAPPGRELAGVLAQAGGNPLYARELVDALMRAGLIRLHGGVAELAAPTGMPASLAAVIAERLGALSDETVSMLQWAAVLGMEFSVVDLGVVTGRVASDLIGALEEAIAEQVVTDAGPRLVFRHGLIRQVLYDGVAGPMRSALHRQAAGALATIGAAPEQVAAQLVAAFEDTAVEARAETEIGWVLRWLTDAAPVLTYRAPQLAAELLRSVLSRLADDDPGRAELEAALMTAAFLLVENEEVARVGLPALAREGDPDRAAEMAWLVGYSLLRAGRAAHAAEVAVAALARPGISEARAARVRALHAMILLALGEWNQTAKVAKQALAEAERAGDSFAAGYALNVLSNLADERGRLAPVDRALDMIGDNPQTTDLRLILLANRASALASLDRMDESIVATRQAMALAERAGTPRLGMIRQILATECFEAGRWDEALIELESATSMPGPVQVLTLSRGLFARIAAHRDDQATAEAQLRAAPDQELRDATALANSSQLLMARAVVAERAGQPEEAMAELARCLDPGFVYDKHVLLPMLTRLALAVGNTAAAAGAAEAAAQQAEREPLPRKTAAADHCRGLLAGDPGPVLAVADYYEATGRPFDRAEALEDAAVLAAQRGDLPAARRGLTTAIGLYASMGAEWDISRAEARLRPYGVSRGRSTYHARPTSGWQALTPTETKVALLVADGRSNPDIAAQLFMSRNTVQTHVAHILAKLGVRSRVEVVRVVSPHPANRATG